MKGIVTTIYSPIEGTLIPIEEVSDPVFSQKMLGDGLAIRPNNTKHTIATPVKGKITTIHAAKHAVTLTTEDNLEVLIHIGIDTVALKGEGFKVLVNSGDKVDIGDNLLQVDFPLIESKAPSSDVMILFTNLTDDMRIEKTNSKHVTASAEIAAITVKEKSTSTVVESEWLQVVNEMGLHARPASIIFNLAKKYTDEIQLQKEHKIINAKSVTSILGLAVQHLDRVKIIAQGDNAPQAIAEISEAIKNGLGEKVNLASSEKISASAAPNIDFSKQLKLKGVIASPGLVVGKSFLEQQQQIAIVETAEDPDSELASLTAAISATKAQLLKEIKQAHQHNHTTKAEIFQAHLAIVEDVHLFENAHLLIDKGKSALFAWRSVINDSIQALQATQNKLLMEKIVDLKDIDKRVIKTILKIDTVNEFHYPDDTIVIAEELSPFDLSKFNNNVTGVIFANGSATAHASLMLRNMGIPTLVAVGNGITGCPNGLDIVLNANKGNLIINPNQDKLAKIITKQGQLLQQNQQNINNANKDAITLDSHKIMVKGSVSNAEQASETLNLGGEGIGLLRTEFLFASSATAPSEDTQHKVYQSVVGAMQCKPVTFRTLDVGGDKPLGYIKIIDEDNPIMGLRGIRNYDDNITIFITQIRAILRIKSLTLCKLMLPMVSEVSEIIKMKKIIYKEAEKLGITKPISIGTMVEIPALSLMAEQFAQHVDFFSIGTNDLAQYTMAMDRGHPNLTKRLGNLNPALLRLIQMTVKGGQKHNIPTAVCGAMASELMSIPLLIGLGVTELSTCMSSIPHVKALIRTLDFQHCQQIAKQAIGMDSVDNVKKLIFKEFDILPHI